MVEISPAPASKHGRGELASDPSHTVINLMFTEGGGKLLP